MIFQIHINVTFFKQREYRKINNTRCEYFTGDAVIIRAFQIPRLYMYVFIGDRIIMFYNGSQSFFLPSSSGQNCANFLLQKLLLVAAPALMNYCLKKFLPQLRAPVENTR